MRMRILPGSLWLAYTLTSPGSVQRLLPPSLTLSACPLLADDASRYAPAPKLLFNVYRVDAGAAMQGVRAEILTVARHRARGTPHLVVLDCLTNTLQWDPVHGVRGPNARVVRAQTTNDAFAIELRSFRDVLSVDAVRGGARPLDAKFGVSANHECYFGNVDVGYRMSFDPAEILRPVRDLAPVRIVNTLWSGVRSPRPSHVFCHEAEMTFYVDVDDFGKK